MNWQYQIRAFYPIYSLVCVGEACRRLGRLRLYSSGFNRSLCRLFFYRRISKVRAAELSRRESTSESSYSKTNSLTLAPVGPRRHQLIIPSTAFLEPSKTASTRPSGRFLTQPPRPKYFA